ncbi:hypothetical protein RHMOL_Rhmol01G0235400 [Rhododendron molle]|uniref:Uncharacterized protein n=1 Tax=Rhododendron molle TaxID=49168 RepID=A0ACC0Q4H1_RHOML|nr:hypothetical protein RHMOL_Rhmol01G0235400 [Rhododendron molle]
MTDCIMAPESKKSSASSNLNGTKRNTAPVRVDTPATTPSEILTLTPSTVASPSTRASASGKCPFVSLDKFKVTENDVEGTELVEQVFNEKANLLYKDWKWRMNDFYTKTVNTAGLEAYQHPFQKMPIDDWKYMIDHVFKDPKREADCEKQRIANEGNDDDGNNND